MVDVYPGVAVANLAILANADASIGIEQIQATPPEAFRALPDGRLAVRDPSWDRSLWIRLTLRAGEPVAGKAASITSVLEVQKPYLDQLTLYTPAAAPTGGWQAQRAGDFLAKDQWSLPGQFPRFKLPSPSDLQAMPGGQMVVYLHVPHRIPAAFDLKIWSDVQLIADVQRDALLLGLTFGAMTLAVFLSIALLIFHRDRLFVWYALYALSALLACLSHAGTAYQYFWPWGGHWPSTSVLCFMLVAASSQLQFCKLLFMSSSRKVWPVRWCEGLGITNIVVALIFPWLELQWWAYALFLAQGLLVASMLGSSGLITVAWLRGNKLAMALAWTFLPVFVTVVLSLLEAQGFIVLTETGYNAPIYAVALEVTLLGLCLQWFGHDRHGKLERERALASTDPLTGFANHEGFVQALQAAWNVSLTEGQDTSVVYVQAIGADDKKLLTKAKLKRCVRLLRTITREGDTVGQLDRDSLGLVLPGLGMGNDLNERMVRLVALGLIPERREPSLRFRIVATSARTFGKPIHDIDSELRLFLNTAEPWTRKPIHYIPKHAAKDRSGFANSDAMNALWNQALDAQRADQSTQP